MIPLNIRKQASLSIEATVSNTSWIPYHRDKINNASDYRTPSYRTSVDGRIASEVRLDRVLQIPIARSERDDGQVHLLQVRNVLNDEEGLFNDELYLAVGGIHFIVSFTNSRILVLITWPQPTR